MLRLTTKGKYGTRLMFQLAQHYGQGPMLLKDVAARENLSLSYLEKLVPLLKSAALIHAIRGAKGGYTLTHKPSEINLKMVIQALEGALYPSECVHLPNVCERSGYCVQRDIWTVVEQKISTALESVTLQDMLRIQLTKTTP
jgi:Rrf2 family protein